MAEVVLGNFDSWVRPLIAGTVFFRMSVAGLGDRATI